MTIHTFQKTILNWFETNQRDLPWRHTQDPYKILVSEVMLQQTQVSRVLIKYKEFLNIFPTINTLAQAPDETLLRTWSGLGYWRRAKFLKQTAHDIITKHNNAFPHDHTTLQTLPGIGPYTAGALACFAFNSTQAFIDTNIRRVYIHFFFPNKKQVSDTDILKIAQQAVYKKDPRTWHWALFDYGALALNTSINKKSRHYTKQSKFEGSFRSFRTQVIKHLLSLPEPKINHDILFDFLEDKLRDSERDYSPQDIINTLIQDKLIKKTNNEYHV